MQDASSPSYRKHETPIEGDFWAALRHETLPKPCQKDVHLTVQEHFENPSARVLYTDAFAIPVFL
jgi:hypothetical protein